MSIQGIFSAANLQKLAGVAAQAGSHLKAHALSSVLLSGAGAAAIYRGVLQHQWKHANEQLGKPVDDKPGEFEGGTIAKAGQAVDCIKKAIRNNVTVDGGIPQAVPGEVATFSRPPHKLKADTTWTELLADLTKVRMVVDDNARNAYDQVPATLHSHLAPVYKARDAALAEAKNAVAGLKIGEIRDELVGAADLLIGKLDGEGNVNALRSLVEGLKGKFEKTQTLADAEQNVGLLGEILAGDITSDTAYSTFEDLWVAVKAEKGLGALVTKKADADAPNGLFELHEAAQGKLGTANADNRKAATAEGKPALLDAMSKALDVALDDKAGGTLFDLKAAATKRHAQSTGNTGKAVVAVAAALFASALVVRYAQQLPALQGVFANIPARIRPYIA